MRKIFFMCLITVVLGCVSGKIIYDKISNIYAYTKSDNTVYLLQLGVYDSKESIKEDVKDIDDLLVVKEKNNYYVYVGISKYKSNLKKISRIYNDLGYNLYLKEEYIDDEMFLNNLKEFDKMLKKSSSDEEIKSICSIILSSYEEMVIN